MSELERVRQDLDDLTALLAAASTIDADDPVYLRLHEIEIELAATEVSAQRLDPRVAIEFVTHKVSSLDEMMTHLAKDVLGYYGLVADPEGANEPPVGGERMRLARSRLLAMRAADADAIMTLKETLAKFIGAAD